MNGLVKKCTKEVCGMRPMGGQRRKSSECWNEENGVAVVKTSRAFDKRLNTRQLENHMTGTMYTNKNL